MQKLAWITGSGSGIGRATALRLVRDGWRIAATSRTQADLDKLVAAPEARGQITAFAGDVTDRLRMTAIISEIEASLGPVDLAFLSAGLYLPFGLDDFSAAKIETLLQVNVIGVANAIEALLPGFRKCNAGHIAVVSSMAQYRGMMRNAGYGASKAALLAMCETLRLQTRDTGIKVQIVVPGFIKTRMTANAAFSLPGMITAEAAAEAAVAGMRQNRFEITMPRHIVAKMRWARLMPDRFYFWYAARTPLFGGSRK